MPGMSGFEFLDELRRTIGGSRIPVIVWTSKDVSDQERVRLRQAAQAVIQKSKTGAGALIEQFRPYLRARAAQASADRPS
jgi:CheY-like chemotaxis protein